MAVELFTERGAICGTFLCGEMLCGAEGDQYVLPDTLVPEADDFSSRIDQEERAFADGSAAWGGQIDSRTLVLAGLVGEDSNTPAETEALFRTVRQKAARQDQKIAFESGGPYLRARFLRDVDHRWPEIWGRRLVRARFSWLLADPFWYAATASSESHAFAGDDSWTLDAGTEATWWMAPVITVTADAGVTVNDFSLTNDSDDGIGFTITDPGLADGASLVVDCAAGTVTRAGANKMQYFSGRPLRLQPGSNVLQYVGNACTINIQWTERWI